MAAPVKSNEKLAGWENVPSMSNKDIPSAIECEKIRKLFYSQLGKIVSQQDILEAKFPAYTHKISLYTIQRPNGNVAFASSGFTNPPHSDEWSGLGFELIAEGHGKEIGFLQKAMIESVRKASKNYFEIFKKAQSNTLFYIGFPANKIVPSRFIDSQGNMNWLLGFNASDKPNNPIPTDIVLRDRKAKLLTARLLKPQEVFRQVEHHENIFKYDGTYHITSLDKPTCKIWIERFWDTRIAQCVKEFPEATQKQMAQIEGAQGDAKKKLIENVKITDWVIYCLHKAYTLLDKIPCISASSKNKLNIMSVKKAVFIQFYKEVFVSTKMQEEAQRMLENMPTRWISIMEYKLHILGVIDMLEDEVISISGMTHKEYWNHALSPLRMTKEEFLEKSKASMEYKVRDAMRCIDCGRLLVNEKEPPASAAEATAPAAAAAVPPAKAESDSKKKTAENPPPAETVIPLSTQISINIHRIKEIIKELRKGVEEIDENLNQLDASETSGKKSKKWKKEASARNEFLIFREKLLTQINAFSAMEKESDKKENTLLERLTVLEKNLLSSRQNLSNWKDQVAEVIEEIVDNTSMLRSKKEKETPKPAAAAPKKMTRKERLEAKNQERLAKQLAKKAEEEANVKTGLKMAASQVNVKKEDDTTPDPTKPAAAIAVGAAAAAAGARPAAVAAAAAGAKSAAAAAAARPAAVQNTSTRRNALQAAFRQLVSLNCCLIYFENNKSKDPGLDACVQHYALQRYLLGCIQALKIYKNYGSHTPEQISKELLADQRNMLVHADWLKTDAKTLQQTMKSVLATAKEYSANLPDKFRQMRLPNQMKSAMSLEQLRELLSIASFAQEDIVELLSRYGVIKAAAAHTYSQDSVFVIDGTPLYQLGAKYHNSKVDNEFSQADHVKAILNNYIPLINSLMVPILKFTDPSNGKTITAEEIKQHFHFQLAAIMMLLTICGELGGLVKNRPKADFAAFCGACIKIRNQVSHRFMEVSVAEIMEAAKKARTLQAAVSDLKQFCF